MRKLNRGQQCIVYNVLGRMMKNERFDIFLSGGSGVGKSRVLQAVYQTLCRLMKGSDESGEPKNNIVVVGAYTGKAAFNVGGLTLHNIFHLPTKCFGKISPMAAAVLTKCKRTFNYTLLFIIDEISLVGSRVFGWIINRVNQMTELRASGELNVSFLVVGDFAQLKPVQDNWIFKSIGQSNPVANILGNPNWVNFKLYELKEIMRQRDDKTFAETLRVIGELGIEFCSKDQIRLLDSRIIDEYEPLNSIPDETIILTHSNKCVKEFNEIRMRNSGKEIVENVACDYAEGKDAKTPFAIKTAESIKDRHLDETQNLTGKLLLVLDKKYLLTKNLRTSDGLAHGNIGRLKRIIYHKKQGRPNCTLVKRVYLQFEDPLIGAKSRQENKHASRDKPEENWTMIECQDLTVKTSKVGKYDFHVNRVQLPLIESEAMTIHKSQGQTYSSVAVNIGDNLSQSLMYVALSRATNVQGLYLFGARSILKKNHTTKSLHALKQTRQSTATKLELDRLRKESMMTDLYPFIFTGKYKYRFNRIFVSSTILT